MNMKLQGVINKTREASASLKLCIKLFLEEVYDIVECVIVVRCE